MLEILLCSLVTIVPDYLFRRYVQNKRIGKEITIYSVWFELRWGITACVILAVSLITVIFYNHPSTTNVTLFFRTIPIISEATGRVAEVYVGFNSPVAKGAPIFRLDSSKQEAAVETARRKIAETEADLVVAQADLLKADGQIQEARSAHQQAVDELATKQELQRLNPGNVARREIERLQNLVEGRLGGIAAASAAKQAVEARISSLLPAQKASAEAALAQAQVELDKTVVRAGVSGRVEQFALRVGDIVTPIARPAGILIPEADWPNLQAGFGQIEAQIMKVGMTAEVTCLSKPFTIIPMVVTYVQDFIAAGQFRGGEQLLEAQQATQPGTLLVFLEPLYKGGLDGVTPGSSCIANAYSNNNELIASKDTGVFKGIALHAVDALALVHALIFGFRRWCSPSKRSCSAHTDGSGPPRLKSVEPILHSAPINAFCAVVSLQRMSLLLALRDRRLAMNLWSLLGTADIGRCSAQT
jgi:multidrug resistance efflux pump